MSCTDGCSVEAHADTSQPQTKGLTLEEVTQMFEGGEVPEEALTEQARKSSNSSYDSKSTLASSERVDEV